MEGSGSDRLRDLPSVNAVLTTAAASVLLERFGRMASTGAVRAALDEARAALRAGAHSVPGAEDLAFRALNRLSADDRSGLRPLFNLTGTVVHTNLGRATLAEAAIEAAVAAMRDPVALELDLSSGKRGERDDHVRALLCALTGAEGATVVNNNAAAVLVVLNTLADGREAVVSRGELIEIGGAFRLPDIMTRAGARNSAESVITVKLFELSDLDERFTSRILLLRNISTFVARHSSSRRVTISWALRSQKS